MQVAILIKKLWSFENLKKSKKSDWTFFLVFFNSISSLIFIWKKVDQFDKMNRKYSTQQGL